MFDPYTSSYCEMVRSIAQGFSYLHVLIFIYAFRLGTVISFYRKDEYAHAFGKPIVQRLRESRSLLRSSADPSFLLQAILDYGRIPQLTCVFSH